MAKILVVEDEIDVRETYIDLLEAAGHTVQGVGTASQALQWLFRNVPDVIILDIHLAGESGLLVLSYVRRLRRMARAKIIVASGHRELLSQAAILWGVDQCLSKPIPGNVLRDSIQKLISVSSGDTKL